jgi:TfoX/Sxy family transcriptional regulator of competence genes
MAFDEALAQRVRTLLARTPGLTEKKMFGGLAFLLNGNMCCGVTGSRLMLRVGDEQYQAALSSPHAREMDFTGRPMRGFVYITSRGIETDKDLAGWIQQALDFVGPLPAK